jgi:hypothetical protein
MDRNLRIAGVLLIVGLVIEAFTLCWNTAASFLSFMIFGGLFLVGGVIVYLYSLASARSTSGSIDRSR